jgi:hypothetical protein
MRRTLAIVLAAGALIGAPAVAPVLTPVGSPVAVAESKTCSKGYKHAVIGGEHKCLRRGQYCARSRDREYHRYGFQARERVPLAERSGPPGHEEARAEDACQPYSTAARAALPSGPDKYPPTVSEETR